jgi:predicted transport protein
MSAIKLFRLGQDTVTELEGHSVAVEKSLQTLIEQHLETFLGIRFLATEYVTPREGRIDTLGLDENGCPVIIEYKRSINQNVISQVLSYLGWLMDHRGEFKLLVLERLGPEPAGRIEWTNPRLLCIAGDFTKHDERAVPQINRNVELIRYRRFGDDLLLLELVNATTTQTNGRDGTGAKVKEPANAGVAVPTQAKVGLQDLHEALKAFLMALGDDVQMKELKSYDAFRRIKNFACVEIHPQSSKLVVFVKVNPDSVHLERGFTRDMRNTGHSGTGDLGVTIRSAEDLERAKPFLLQSYEAS